MKGSLFCLKHRKRRLTMPVGFYRQAKWFNYLHEKSDVETVVQTVED